MSAKSTISRRNFLYYGGAAALGCTGLSTLRLASSNTAVEAAPLASPAVECPAGLTLSENLCLRDVALRDFAPLLGQEFSVAGAGKPAILRLLEASSHARPGVNLPADARNEPFSLLFVAEDGNLPDAIHDVQHPATGPLKLFLGQIGGAHESGKAYYEVVFG